MYNLLKSCFIVVESGDTQTSYVTSS